MTNMYPHLLSAIKAANDVRTERDATNGNLDTFISAVVPVMLHGLTGNGDEISSDDISDWYAEMTPEEAALICTAYAIPESVTETRTHDIRDAFLRTWTDEAGRFIARATI